MSSPAYSQAMASEIAASSNVLFVAAAGNENVNTDRSPSYPGGYSATLSNVLVVGASTRSDTRSSYSNYGARSVDLMAPGDTVLSTVPGGGYGAYSGTSMPPPTGLAPPRCCCR